MWCAFHTRSTEEISFFSPCKNMERSGQMWLRGFWNHLNEARFRIHMVVMKRFEKVPELHDLLSQIHEAALSIWTSVKALLLPRKSNHVRGPPGYCMQHVTDTCTPKGLHNINSAIWGENSVWTHSTKPPAPQRRSIRRFCSLKISIKSRIHILLSSPTSFSQDQCLSYLRNLKLIILYSVGCAN